MKIRTVLAAALMAGQGAVTVPALAAPDATQIPHFVSKGGRHALIVDGAPFLMLSGQVNNSTNYPEPLAKTWAVLDRIHDRPR